MKKHKWNKEIKAWDDGAEIEYLSDTGEWFTIITPFSEEKIMYRFKPQPREPQYLYVYKDEGGYPLISFDKNNSANYISKIKLED